MTTPAVLLQQPSCTAPITQETGAIRLSPSLAERAIEALSSTDKAGKGVLNKLAPSHRERQHRHNERATLNEQLRYPHDPGHSGRYRRFLFWCHGRLPGDIGRTDNRCDHCPRRRIRPQRYQLGLSGDTDVRLGRHGGYETPPAASSTSPRAARIWPSKATARSSSRDAPSSRKMADARCP
jgi:hypothetical protein